MHCPLPCGLVLCTGWSLFALVCVKLVCSELLPIATTLAGMVKRSVMSDRLFPSFEPTDLCLYTVHDHSSPGIESQGHKSRSMLKVCVLHEYLLRLPVTDGRNSRFLLSRRQLRTSAARISAWCGRGRRQRQSPARVGVVMRLRGRSDLDP